MVNITVSLTGANGDTIVFDQDNYVLETGVRGFGIPQPIVRIDKSAGNGGVFRFSKRDVRELDLPISILGVDVEDKLRRLSKILAGAVTITADYGDGNSFYLVGYYNGGAETQFGKDATQSYCRWVVTLSCPQPFWTSVKPISFNVAQTGTAGLLNAVSLTSLAVSSAQALGNITVQNTGDVDAPVIWQIKGPSTNVSFTLNGVGFSYTETITSSDTITIDTDKGTVVNQNGVNKYSFLSSAPKLFSIPTGSSVISITATGADANTKISGFFNPRREVIH